MMRSFLLFVSVSLFALSIAAQSGRVVQPTPTPPVSDESLTYSESAPRPKRPLPLRPSLAPVSGPGSPNVQTPGASGKRPVVGANAEDVQRVETNLITIPVSVFDRNGLYISNLKKEDFRVFEDGKEQEIAYFGTSEKPFTVILAIDISPSTAYEINEIRDAAIAFVNLLKAQDKVMVIEFDAKVNVLTKLTGDRGAINKAIRKADFGSGTSVYDAVNFAISRGLNAVKGRKAVVLFTDGVDTQSSQASYDSTIALAEESDSLIFPIYYNTFEDTQADLIDVGGPPPPGTTAAEYELGKKYLVELADYTGGRVFQPASTPGGLTAAFEGIAEELRRQYNIGYMPTEDGRPGQRKQIKVRVNRANLVLRARDSYIVGSR